MRKWNSFLGLAIGGILLGTMSCQPKQTEGTKVVAFDPSKPVVVSDFYPDSGGIATSMIISGDNFGSDTASLKVLYVDEDGVAHQGGLVSSTGSKIYCTVPKGLTYKRDITVRVVRQHDGKEVSGEAADKFIYKTQTAVTTVVGQPNVNNQPTNPGSLTTTTLSAPAYICLDDEDNIFIAERTFDYQYAHDSKGSSIGYNGNVLIASLERDNVQLVAEKVPLINAPAYSDEPGFESVYMPFDPGLDFLSFSKATNYAMRKQPIIKGEDTRDLDTKNWKYSFVVNKVDKQIYTVMFKGQLVRINPKTRKMTKLLDKIGTHSTGGGGAGTDSFLAFSPVNPNRLFIVQSHNHEIWYVDVDQLGDKSVTDYHGEPYAGRAISEGVSAGRGWEDGLLRNAKFDEPRQAAFTADGKLYIADSKNHCIRAIDTTLPDDKATVTTVIGLPGTAGFKEGGPEIAQFRRPHGVAVNADASVVYIADTGNRCIRKLTIE